MIVSSVHDPHVLLPLAGSDAVSRDQVLTHLLEIAHSHIVVLDLKDRMGKALLTCCESLPDMVRKRIELCLCSRRVVRVPCDESQAERIAHLFGNRPDTALALSLDQDGVDVILTDEDGKAAAQLEFPNQAHLYTLAEYHASDPYLRLLDTLGGVSLKGTPQSVFVDKIIRPIFRWSRQVRIIDRYVCKASYEDVGVQTDSQWPRYQRTLRLMYNEWASHVRLKDDRFVVMTESALDRGPADVQARHLWEMLDLGPLSSVELIRVPKYLRDVEHERYLWTDREIVLSFSRGFDLFLPNGKSIECNVSLYREGCLPTFGELLKLPPVAEYRGEH